MRSDERSPHSQAVSQRPRHESTNSGGEPDGEVRQQSILDVILTEDELYQPPAGGDGQNVTFLAVATWWSSASTSDPARFRRSAGV